MNDQSPLKCSRTMSPTESAPLSSEERAVLNAIRGTSFGAVAVVVHQARIVQIVKTEKVRVDGANVPT